MSLKERSYNCSCSLPLSKEEQEEFEKEKLNIARKRNLEDKALLSKLSKKERIIYKIAKIVAESDSIGEGYSYCEYYGVRNFCCDGEYRGVAEEIYKIVQES